MKRDFVHRVVSDLISGVDLGVIAKNYSIDLTDIVKYKKELEDGEDIEGLIKAIGSHDIAIAMLGDKIKEEVARANILPPRKLDKFNSDITDLTDGLTSIQKLDLSFHTTITSLLSWADKQITDDMELNTWVVLADKIGVLHKAIFSSGVNVNVQQNTQNNSFSSGMVN